jgi:hypothetical protein
MHAMQLQVLDLFHIANGVRGFPIMQDRSSEFERHRRRLFGIAYRMLSPRADAEDVCYRMLTCTGIESGVRDSLSMAYSVEKLDRREVLPRPV